MSDKEGEGYVYVGGEREGESYVRSGEGEGYVQSGGGIRMKPARKTRTRQNGKRDRRTRLQ